MNIKNFAFAAAIIMCLAISYYFVIALPNQNQAKLDMEKQKIEREQQEKSNREMSLSTCMADVQARRSEYLKLNGKPIPGKPGVYKYPGYVQETLDKIEKDGNDECIRMYGDHR